jgi:hypothetical protein
MEKNELKKNGGLRRTALLKKARVEKLTKKK